MYDPPTAPSSPANSTENSDDEATEAQARAAAATTPTTTHTPIVFTADCLPNATGDIAKSFANTPLELQRNNAIALYEYLWNQQEITRVNVGKPLMTALVSIPNTCQIKVVYGLGYGTAGLGQTSQINDKFIMLHGEGNNTDIGYPDVLMLDTNIRKQSKVLNPSDAIIQELLTTKGEKFGNHLLPPRTTNTTKNIMNIAPIPAYLIYDGFEKELNAADIYERILQETAHPSDMLTHAAAFLRSTLIGPYRNDDNKPFVPLQDWNRMIPREAKLWRKEKVEAIFPHIFITPALPATHPTTAPPTNTTNDANSILIATLLAELQKTKATNTTYDEEEKKEDASPITKVSTFEKTILKTMCGIPSNCDDDILPTWYLHLFRKHQDDKDRDHIVAETLNGMARFEDADIPVYPELKKMILKRNWVGGEAGGNPKYAYACYGLTPFAMLDLTEDQIATMEMDQHFLRESSTITPQDIKASKGKLQATIPTDGTKWKQIILRFTNLLLLLFKGDCPLYIKMLDIAKALRKYPTEVMQNLPMHAKASILWIIHLQSRHFAQGKMKSERPNEMCLPAFGLMYNQICSTAIHTVSVAGLPAKFESTPDTLPRKNPAPLPPKPNQEPPQKIPKLNHINKQEGPWHPKLKAALVGPLKTAGYPTLRDIARHCQLLRDDNVVPNVAKDACRAWIIFGQCRYGKKCRFQHPTASDEQAEQILKKFEKFIQAPDQLKKGERQQY